MTTDPRAPILEQEMYALTHNWLRPEETARFLDALNRVDPLRQPDARRRREALLDAALDIIPGPSIRAAEDTP